MTQEQAPTRRIGIFVPLSEEQHRAIKVQAATEGKKVQDIAADALLAGLGKVGNAAQGNARGGRGRRRAS